MCLLAAHLLQYRSSLCLHPGNRLSLLCFYIASLWLRRFLLVGCRQVEFAPSFLCEWSQRSWLSQQMVLLPLGFFVRTPSRIRRRVKICDVMDLFLQKPFWFFQSMFSILGSIWLCSRALYILTATDVRVIPQKFLANLRLPFLGKGRMHPFVHLSIGFWLYTALQCQSSMSSNCLVFYTSGGISSSPTAFLFLIFLSTESSSSCVNDPSLMFYC